MLQFTVPFLFLFAHDFRFCGSSGKSTQSFEIFPANFSFGQEILWSGTGFLPCSHAHWGLLLSAAAEDEGIPFPLYLHFSSFFEEFVDRRIRFFLDSNGLLMSEVRLVGIHPHPGPASPRRQSWTPWDSFELHLGSPGPRDRSRLDSSADSSIVDCIPISTAQKPVFCSANVNSLTSKLDSDVRPLLNAYDFAVFALQETKLNSTVKLSELNVPNYSFFRRDRPKNGRNGGGVGLYILNSLKPKRIKLLSAPNLELIAAEIMIRGRNMIVASVYNPPRVTKAEFVSDFTDAIAELQGRSKYLVIMGDTNIDGLSPQFDELKHGLVPFNMSQVIQEPTHLGHCLDHVFLTDSARFHAASGVGPPIEKNHCITWIQLQHCNVGRPPKTTSVAWKYDDADWDRAKFLLLNGNLAEEISDPNLSVDDAALHLSSVFYDIQSLVVPHKEVWFRQDSCPWMEKRLLRLFQRRNCAHKRFRDTNSPRHGAVWRKFRKMCKMECKVAKKTYLQQAFDGVKNAKDYWRIVNRFNHDRAKVPINLKLRDGSMISECGQKANAFAEEFSQNFNSGPDDCDHIYLERTFDARWTCQEVDVVFYIRQLRNDAAIGVDGISPKFLKNCADEVAPAICALINRCLFDSHFPNLWKSAKIIPIPKVPGTDLVSEHRPISILPVISKIAEKWLKDQLSPFIMANIDANQFAYSHGRSTEDAINLLQYFVTCGFDACANVTRVAIVSFDVQKAFDKVHRNRLLLVLRTKFGLPDGLAALVDSYLTERKQTVVVGGESSVAADVSSGVAQGSILGPHLFNAFLTSVLSLQLSENSKLIAFADDVVLIKPIILEADSLALQQDIDCITQEYSRLCLTLNEAKTNYSLCSLAPVQEHVRLDFSPTVNGHEIGRKSTFKYLGVTVDQKLSFGAHVELQSAKAKRAIGALWRTLGRWTSREHFCEIYVKKILPLYCYALPCSSPTTRKHWEILEKVHRFAARLASNNYTGRYSDILNFLHWKPIARLCVERQLMLQFKYIEGLRFLPPNVLVVSAPPPRLLRRAGRHNRHLELNLEIFHPNRHHPPRRTTIGQIPFAFGIAAWNLLPPEIADLGEQDLNSFKREIRSDDLFRLLEDKAARSLIPIPPLKRFYENL